MRKIVQNGRESGRNNQEITERYKEKMRMKIADGRANYFIISNSFVCSQLTWTRSMRY